MRQLANAILWVEGDDEAQSSKFPHRPLQSLLAYVLLSEHAVIHPAYIWQSQETNDLIFKIGPKRLHQAGVQLFLSRDAESVAEYMRSRIESGEKSEAPNLPLRSEFEEYAQFEIKVRRSQEDALDAVITGGGGVIKSGWSRDQEFRRLVTRDLGDHGIASDAIFGILMRDPVSKTITKNLIPRITDLTRDPDKLCSTDTILAEVVLAGSYSQKTLRKAHDRLTALHWACHLGDDVAVPFVQRVEDSERVDPLDPIVFWAALSGVLRSGRVETWLSMSPVDAFAIAIELRSAPEWREFVERYRQVVTILADDIGVVDSAEVVKNINAILPGRARVIARQFRALPLVRQVFETLGTTADPISLGVSTAGTVAGLTQQIIEGSRKFDQSLRHDLDRTVRSAIRRVRPE